MPTVFAFNPDSLRANVSQESIDRYTNISSEVNQKVETFGWIQFIILVLIIGIVLTVIYIAKTKKSKKEENKM